MPDAPRGSMRLDLLSAYAAGVSRVLSWVIVSALVYRESTEAFAMLALVRGTLGILNYAAIGLLPAMIRMLANPPRPTMIEPKAITNAYRESKILSYESASETVDSADIDPIGIIYASGSRITIFAGVLAAVSVCGIAARITTFYRIPDGVNVEDAKMLVLALGGGIVLRWLGDPSAALLQTRGRIALDAWISTASEILWVAAAYAFLHTNRYGPFRDNMLRPVGGAFCLASAFQLFARKKCARTLNPSIGTAMPVGAVARGLLGAGALITLAQLADYMYAPTDLILINRLLSASDLADYAPALQIDSGLLLLVTGLGAVLLPKAALAHAAGDGKRVRQYYVRGTLASAALLLAASVGIYFAAPLLFRLWFGDPMPGTVAVLPWVLLNTVVGGSAAVGRAILIGIGKARAFTISVLLAGVTNIACSYVFVRYLHWGLKGIVLGTVVAVLFRCAVWMPWYVTRQLRDLSEPGCPQPGLGI